MLNTHDIFDGKQGEAFLTALHDLSIKHGVSDVHFFPRETVVQLGWRQDGIMQSVYDMTPELYTDVLRRIKFASRMSLNVTYIPQDGEYSFPHEGAVVKVRVSTMPSKFGEALTLRILDPRKGILPLEKLGFQQDINEQLHEIMETPNGIVLVTGPTGSGKTTTLYSLLATQIGTGKNIITLEDPIEYEIPGILQSQIDHKREYTFALGLRAILRQDPDIVLVGEVRDGETAKTAADAALTGHMVFATLHTNSAIESIPRLSAMGVDSYLLAPALRSVLAQRLIRRVCSTCHADGSECETCLGTGYKGRMCLPELLIVSKDLRDLILANAPQKDLEAQAAKEGFRTMRERGMELVQEGATTEEEIHRVTAS